MSRPARLFLHGERVACAKCGKAGHFGLLGPLHVCNANTGRGSERGRCGTFHYVLTGPTGNAVCYVRPDEVERIRTAEDKDKEVQALGLDRVAKEIHRGVAMRRAA